MWMGTAAPGGEGCWTRAFGRRGVLDSQQSGALAEAEGGRPGPRARPGAGQFVWWLARRAFAGFATATEPTQSPPQK